MAVPSNRSPSPLSSRPIHPHSRNPSDSNASSAARRSFNGNPFPRPSVLSNPRGLNNPITPANSPAGFGRRNSLGGDEKENTVKAVKSPANGSKNFMSPTISAASKFTPSPRKKVLVERNDPVRTSISLSEGKAMFFSEISSEIKAELPVLDHQNGEGKDVVLEGSRGSSKASKRVTFLEVPSDSANATEVKPDDPKTVVDSVSPIIAPLDADPSLPPYNPKTNYLSPRPQFLHYKPNLRFEVLLNKEKVLDLDFSDSDGTEGSVSEDSQKDSEDSSSAENVMVVPQAEEEEVHVYEESTISEGIVEEKEEPKTPNSLISYDDLCEGIVEGKDEEKPSISPPNSYDVSQEAVVYDIGKAKPRFFNKLKSVFVLLVLMIACTSIWSTNSPVMEDSLSSVLNILKSSKLNEPSKFVLSAKANFNGLGERIKQLSFDSISSLSLLIDNLGRGGDNLGTVKFMNLTDLQSSDMMSVCGYLEGHKQSQTFTRANFNGLGERIKQLSFDSISSLSLLIDNLGRGGDNLGTVKFMNLTDLQSSDMMSVCGYLEGHKQSQTFTRDLEEEDLEEVGEEDAESEFFEEQTFAHEKKSEEEIDLESEELLAPALAESEIFEEQTLAEVFCYGICEKESELGTEELAPAPAQPTDMIEIKHSEAPDVEFESEVYKIYPEVNEAGNSGSKFESFSADTDDESTSNTPPAIAEDISSEVVQFPIEEESENKHSAYSVIGIMASLVLALVSAATAFVYSKQSNSSNPRNKINPGVSSVPKRLFEERGSLSHNWATEVVDVEGEESCCPSEMSSFERNSSYSKRKDLKGGGAYEAQSQERKARKFSKRESLASSSEFSTGSPSYGSFTTYERISSKNENGDDEIVTPIRRSSRLRNQVTCP